MNPSTELHDLTIQIAHAISDGDVAVLERHTAGQTIRIQVLREGKQADVDVTLAPPQQ